MIRMQDKRVRVKIARVLIDLVDIQQACDIAQNYVEQYKRFKGKEPAKMIQAVNVDAVVKAHLRHDVTRVTNKADLALADGEPIVWASKFLGEPLRERVGGPDFFEQFNKVANERGYSYYFLGATEDVVEKMKSNLLRKYPNIVVSGYYCPPFGPMEDEKENSLICEKINLANPDVVWVSFGCPKQEKWIFNNKDQLNTAFVMGIGAVFQFYAGTIKRAPKWQQKIGFEWFYRLISEPRRLWRRYLLEGPRFFFYVISEKNSQML